jgi:hypothetical protein
MKIKSCILVAFLIAGSQLCLAQEESPAKSVERFQFKPAPSGSPLVILKSDLRTMEVDPRNNEIFDMESIDKKWIKSITVLKAENAKLTYGERAANGVLILQLVDNYIFTNAIYKKIKADN